MVTKLTTLSTSECGGQPEADEGDIASVERRIGLPRRQFLQIFAGVVAAMGLPSTAYGTVLKAVAQARRPSVIWLHFQECTGCTESLLRAEHPTLEKLILDVISLDYHETLMAAAGHQAEAARRRRDGGEQGQVHPRRRGRDPDQRERHLLQDRRPDRDRAASRSAPPTPPRSSRSGAARRGAACRRPRRTRPARARSPRSSASRSLTIPGCPPNPYNFLTTVVHYLTFGKLPELDAKGRPKFAYGRLIHENCERRAHFDAGRFAIEFGDEGHRQGWCLYKLGCKGPETYANCPSILFGDAGTGTWPVGSGHPVHRLHRARASASPSRSTRSPKLLTVTPPTQFARPAEAQGKGSHARQRRGGRRGRRARHRRRRADRAEPRQARRRSRRSNAAASSEALTRGPMLTRRTCSRASPARRARSPRSQAIDAEAREHEADARRRRSASSTTARCASAAARASPRARRPTACRRSAPSSPSATTGTRRSTSRARRSTSSRPTGTATGTHKDQVKDGFAFTKTSCMHCVDPSCVSACPVSAMTEGSGHRHRQLRRRRVHRLPLLRRRRARSTCRASPTTRRSPKISKCQLCEHRLRDGQVRGVRRGLPDRRDALRPGGGPKKEIARRRALDAGHSDRRSRAASIGGTDTYVGTVGSVRRPRLRREGDRRHAGAAPLGRALRAPQQAGAPRRRARRASPSRCSTPSTTASSRRSRSSARSAVARLAAHARRRAGDTEVDSKEVSS